MEFTTTVNRLYIPRKHGGKDLQSIEGAHHNGNEELFTKKSSPFSEFYAENIRI